MRVLSFRAGKWEALDQSESVISKGVLKFGQWRERTVCARVVESIHRVIDIIRQCGLGLCRDEMCFKDVNIKI